jgi:alkyldihydroxyacetonephosphate synthase
VRRRKFWGWGYEDEQPARADIEAVAAQARAMLGFGGDRIDEPVALGDVALPPPRLAPPRALADFSRADDYSRVSHAYGKSYRDVVRGFRGEITHPPDFVACPVSESDVVAVLDWCSGARAAVIPYGGGTSVVGGVEPVVGDGYAGTVSLDLGGLDRILEVDPVSRAARIEAGAGLPAIDAALRPHGFTLRLYPQSYAFATLGGSLATRAGGHFATGWTHIDDFAESIRAVTPAGRWESRRLPGSGAGPSPDRLLLGSEGILGVITEAWMRVQPLPVFRASASVSYGSFAAGAAAVRALAQSGLAPSNCRLLDPGEAAVNEVARDGTAVLLLGFESADHPLDAWLARALELARDNGGTPRERSGGSAARRAGRSLRRGAASRGGACDAEAKRDQKCGGEAGPEARRWSATDSAESWKERFLAAPYVRDWLVAAGVLVETFETAITWDRFEAFEAAVRARTEAALREVCGEGRVTARLTHAYPDGAALYLTVLAPARRGDELRQWDEIKAVASDALIEAGGTITHHHAVGRDHRRWYDRQRPDPFAAALRAAKLTLDPAGILNPGVLVDPQPPLP